MGRKTMAVVVAGGILTIWVALFGGKAVFSDWNPTLGEPVSTDIITPVRFELEYSREALDSLRNLARVAAPVVLQLDSSLRRRSLAELRVALENLGADSSYTAGIERNDYYGNGIIDMEALRAFTSSDSVVVVHGDNTRTHAVMQSYTDIREARASLRRVLQPAFPEFAESLADFLRADLIPVPSATDSAANQAANRVDRVERVYLQGDTLLRMGGIADHEFLRVFNAMNSAASYPGPLRAAARLIPPVFIVVMGIAYGAKCMGKVLTSPFRVLLLGSIWMLALVCTGLLWKADPGSRVIAFSVFGACMTAVFFDSSGVYHSWFLALLFSALAALGSESPFTLFIVSALPAISTSGVFRQVSERGISLALLSSIAFSVLVYWALHTMWIGPGYAFNLGIVARLAGVPFISIAIARVLIHPVELLFRVTTPLTYAGLLSDSHPLRVRMRSEAMGTYQHSMQVAELASAAARQLGADQDLARMGGYYHDIGKLKQPGMFIENMTDQAFYNPHDHMDPYESAAVIIDHVASGLKLARKHHLPQEVGDIIREHHGTGRAMSFLVKARKNARPGEVVDERAFEYPGPPPRSIEAALVMTADAASSAARMLNDKDEIAQAVKRTIQEKDAEGQFDQCGLNRSKQEDVWHVFMDILNRTDYERVKDYPVGS